MNKIRILLFCGFVIALVSAVPPQEEIPAGHEDYDLPLEEEFVEETTTTLRPARRRLPGSRAKAKNAAELPAKSSPTTTTTTEKPAKRTRTSSGSSGGSRTTTTKAPVDVTEQPVSTYRRPKFPPRRLPIPTKKPVTEAPVEELLTEEPLYEDELLGPDGQPEAPIEEDLAPQGAR